MAEKIPEKVSKERVEMIPLKHLGNPKDIASIFAFLATVYVGYISGPIIIADVWKI